MMVVAAVQGDRHSFVFPVEQQWCTGDRLFGGAAFGAVLAALELDVGRPTIAASAQFVNTGRLEEPLSIATEVLVAGTGAMQARASAGQGARTVAQVSASLGALEPAGSGTPSGAVEGGRVAPVVTAPERCRPREYQNPLAGSITETLEVRVAHVSSATVVLWARWSGAPSSAAPAPVLAMLADHVPYGVRLVRGPELYGVSLDATLRVMPAAAAWEPSAWVGLEITYDMLGAFGHGTVWLWGLDGRPLAISTQSIRIRHW